MVDTFRSFFVLCGLFARAFLLYHIPSFFSSPCANFYLYTYIRARACNRNVKNAQKQWREKVRLQRGAVNKM